MNIISKYKDYYDYLTKIYGVDNKIVLDRRESQQSILSDSDAHLVLIICGIKYEGYYDGSHFYWCDEVWQKANNSKSGTAKDNHWHWKWHPEKLKQKYCYVTDKYSLSNKRLFTYEISTVALEGYDHVNEEYKCPILLGRKNCSNDRRLLPTDFVKYPKLIDLDFASVVKPMDMYLMLSQYLAPKDIVVDTRSNDEKVVTNGFDLKTSFRNVK